MEQYNITDAVVDYRDKAVSNIQKHQINVDSQQFATIVLFRMLNKNSIRRCTETNCHLRFFQKTSSCEQASNIFQASEACTVEPQNSHALKHAYIPVSCIAMSPTAETPAKFCWSCNAMHTRMLTYCISFETLFCG